MVDAVGSALPVFFWLLCVDNSAIVAVSVGVPAFAATAMATRTPAAPSCYSSKCDSQLCCCSHLAVARLNAIITAGCLR